MLIKVNSIAATDPTPHTLGPKQKNGTYLVQHPAEGCECMIVYSVHHAPWVSYNGMSGRLFCDRCKAEALVPLPAVRENWFSKKVLMNFQAIEDDLFKFQLKHESCVDTAPPPSG